MTIIERDPLVLPAAGGVTIATPLLVARTVPSAPAQVFDVISEISAEGAAWAIRDSVTGEETVRVEDRLSGAKLRDRVIRGVVEWATGRKVAGGPAHVRIHSFMIRELAETTLDPEVFVLDHHLHHPRSAAWAATRRGHLRDRLRAAETRKYRSRVLYAASDGSAHPVHGNASYSWVTNEGRWKVGPSGGTIFIAELKAALSFAAAFVRDARHSRAVLFMDSLNAVRAIEQRDIRAGRDLYPDHLAAMYGLLDGKRLEIIWVPGHQGHALNEVADALAVQKHRARGSDMPLEVMYPLCTRVVARARRELQTTDWRAVTAQARSAYQSHVARNPQRPLPAAHV